VKRRDLIKEIEDLGCIFIRHGGKHDGIKIRRQKSPSLCHDIATSKNISRGTS
jgi:hypothetical protein